MGSSTLKALLRIIGVLTLIGSIAIGYEAGDLIHHSLIGLICGFLVGLVPFSLLFFIGNIAEDVQDMKSSMSLIYQKIAQINRNADASVQGRTGKNEK